MPKISRFSILLPFFLASSLMAGEYIVPKEYDNTYNSIKSKGYLVITNSSSRFSSKSYSLMGQSVKMRCARPIDVIPCRAPYNKQNIHVSLVDIGLFANDATDKSNTLPVGETKITAERNGNKWLICGAASSYERWDKAELTSSDTSDRKKEIKLNYEPNEYKDRLIFFSNLNRVTSRDSNGQLTGVSRGNNGSYMLISVQQSCSQ